MMKSESVKVKAWSESVKCENESVKVWKMLQISPKDDNKVDNEEVAIDQHGIVHVLLSQVPTGTMSW